MSETAKPKKFAIIDGKSVFYRGYYAMPNLSTKDGVPTGGVFGFASMALEVLRQLKPDYVAVAWDKPKTNIRKRLELYPEYKAGRKPPPADFYEQIPVLHDLLEAFGWPLYELDDYEADDIMGTLALKAVEKGIDVQLVTSDLDMLQLVHPNIHVYALKKGLSNIELFHPESFTAKYGIRPDQFLDLKALMGDSSDNIPGVPGVGQKTALELLKTYGSLDEIYDNLALIKASVSKKLADGKALAELSKKLAAIWTDAPIDIDLHAIDGTKADPERIRETLQKLEFRSLLRHLPEVMQIAEQHELRNVFEHGKAGEIVVIDSDTKLLDIALEPDNKLFVHSRAAGRHGRDPQVLILNNDTDTTYVLRLDTLKREYVQKCLSAIKTVIGYDVKYTLKVLLELGIELPAVGHDVMVGAFILNCLRREQTLTELAAVEMGYEGLPFEDLSTEEVVERSAEIIAVIKTLARQQIEDLEAVPKFTDLATEVEWPVISVLARMEYAGIQLDSKYLNTMAEDLHDRISDVEQQIYGFADQEFNISSPNQLADILFNKLGLKTAGIKKGKTGYSTAANELDKLRESHPIINLITEYREYTKLKNTYVDTLPKLTDTNSRVHTTFNLTIAQTGRLSSTEPNLQNIPVRTELGKQIRTAFVAGQGKMLVSADYSQFELRLAAYLAGDKDLIALFNKDVDIHTATAAQVYGRDTEDVTKNMRRDAKAVNFGVLYGMSAHGLSVATGMTREQAQNFIDKYFELRKPLLDYMNNLKAKARDDGYVETLFGRRRPTPDIHSSNFVVRQAAERAAINMPIQGTEADLMKMAMVKLQQEFDTDARFTSLPEADRPVMLLQIHDSLIVECGEAVAKDVAKHMQSSMEAVYTLPVKLTVDYTIGKNWGEL